MRAALAVLLVLGLSGCAAGASSTTVDGVTVLSAPGGSGDQREGLIEGALNLDKGCLVIVDTEGVPHGLILPEPAMVIAGEDGLTVTVDGVDYGIHDAVRFSGGFSSSPQAPCDFRSYFTPNGVQE